MSSGSPFRIPDDSSQSKVNKQKTLKIIARMARTPCANLPSVPVGKKHLENPSPLEQLWYLAHERLGPVGSKPKDPPPQSKVAPQSPKQFHPTAQPLKPQEVNSPPRKKIRQPVMLAPVESLNTSFIEFNGPPTQPHGQGAWMEGHPIALDFLKKLCSLVWVVSPSARICPFPPKQGGNTLNPPPTFDQNSTIQPKDYWTCLRYLRNCFISPAGYAPSGSICVKHLGSMTKLVDKLNRLNQEFTFKPHPIQAMNLASAAWLAHSNNTTNVEDLAEAIRQQRLFQLLLKEFPTVQIQLRHGFIRIHKDEKVPWSNRVKAVFIWTQVEHRLKVFQVLQKTHEPKKKTGFPLHRKCVALPDTADVASRASSTTRRQVQTARERQRSFLRTNITSELLNAIEHPQAPLYNGSQSLMDHLIGFMIPDPHGKGLVPLFREINRSPIFENGYCFSFSNSLAGPAQEMIDRLGIFCQERWGTGVKNAFSEA